MGHLRVCTVATGSVRSATTRGGVSPCRAGYGAGQSSPVPTRAGYQRSTTHEKLPHRRPSPRARGISGFCLPNSSLTGAPSPRARGINGRQGKSVCADAPPSPRARGINGRQGKSVCADAPPPHARGVSTAASSPLAAASRPRPRACGASKKPPSTPPRRFRPRPPCAWGNQRRSRARLQRSQYPPRARGVPEKCQKLKRRA